MNLNIINLCISTIAFLLVYFKISRSLKEYFNLKRLQNTTNIPYEEYIHNKEILDDMINEMFSVYVVLHYEYVEDLYIKEDDQKRMVKDITEDVITKLSPELVDRFSLIYNREQLPNIITEKIYIAVTDYAIKKNSIKNKEE